MTQGAEAFRPILDDDEQSVPEKKEAVILHFRPKEAVKEEVNPMWEKHARFMAMTAKIPISDDAVKIYSRLRNEKFDPEKENHSGMSDHHLLAEALRLSGDRCEDVPCFEVFKKSLPHIFNSKP